MAPNFNDQTSQVLVNGFPCLSGFLIVYFFFVRYALEGQIMHRYFRKAYGDLTIVNQRSFTAHVLWMVVKLSLVPAAWPFIQVFFCGKSLKEGIVKGSVVSNADYLSVAYFAVIGMFLFEIIYRLKISPVSLIHHTAGCALSAWQVVEQVQQDNASTESQYKMLILYGVFEVVFETFPHIAVVYYRCQPKNSIGLHKTSRIWLWSGISSLIGTTTELVAMAVFMWKNWYKWELGMKIVLPILHFAFMAAQVHGARVGFQLHFSYKKRAIEATEKEEQVEASSGNINTTTAGTEKQDMIAARVERESSTDESINKDGSTQGLPPCYCRFPPDNLALPLYPAA